MPIGLSTDPNENHLLHIRINIQCKKSDFAILAGKHDFVNLVGKHMLRFWQKIWFCAFGKKCGFALLAKT